MKMPTSTALLLVLGATVVDAYDPIPPYTPRPWCEDADAHDMLINMCDADRYEPDGSNMTLDGPNARYVSNHVCKGPDMMSMRWHSDMVWSWGQFLDHDLDLTPGGDDTGDMEVPVPANDTDFSGKCSYMAKMKRSIFTYDSGRRRQENEITPYIDAGAVYGSCLDRANALRNFTDGLLLTSGPNDCLLPKNTFGLENEGKGPEFFAAGDVRVNEQVGLTAMHTLFVREHNRLAKSIKKKHFNGQTCTGYAGATTGCDEEIYQLARRIVGAIMQKVTYEEFLPAILGPQTVNIHDNAFDPEVDPQIANEFSTCAYRFGHSMVSNEVIPGKLSLKDAFFNPGFITEETVDDLLCSFVFQGAQNIDTKIVPGLRSFLFGGFDKTSSCNDLAVNNMMRGYDHGLPTCNVMREDMGLGKHPGWHSLTSKSDLRWKLKKAYGADGVDMVDCWICALAEDPWRGSSLGELATYIMHDQFWRLMKGDKYFYKRDDVLYGDHMKGIIDWDKEGKLASVIIRNIKKEDVDIKPWRNVFFTHGSARSWGDPHFQTWNGEMFDFHGECDLVLGSAPSFGNGLGLTIHVRTTLRYDYSYIESAAIKIGEDVFELSSFGEFNLNGVEDVEMPATIAGFSIDQEVSNKKKHVFTIKISDDSTITLSTYKFLVRVDWDISGSDAEQFHDVTGLMGSWYNGTHYARDGKTILEESNEFGMEWQVRETDPVLFDVSRAPQYPAQCRMPDPEALFKRRRLGQSRISVEQAGTACGHIKEERTHAMCVRDVMALQDLSVAQGAY